MNCEDIEVYCDGAYYPKHPDTPAWAGFVVRADDRVLIRRAAKVNAADSQDAELKALKMALNYLARVGAKRATVHTDCQGAYRYLCGGRCRNRQYYPTLKAIHVLSKKIGDVRFRWIPRYRNKEADKLCRGPAAQYLRANCA